MIRLPQPVTWTCPPVAAAAHIQSLAMIHQPQLIFTDLDSANVDLKIIAISAIDLTPLLIANCLIDGDGYTCIEWYLPDEIRSAYRDVCVSFLEAVRRRGNDHRLDRRRIGFRK